jgi:hypothetical protein
VAVIPFPPPFRVSVSFWGIWVCALLLLLLLFTNGSSVQIPNAPNLLIEPPNPIKIKSQLNERSFFNTRPENPGWSGGGGSLNGEIPRAHTDSESNPKLAKAKADPNLEEPRHKHAQLHSNNKSKTQNPKTF